MIRNSIFLTNQFKRISLSKTSGRVNRLILSSPSTSSSAFTLTEIVVAIAILAVLSIGVAEIFTVGLTALKKNISANSLESAVDKDLANIKDISYRYTCCAGECTIDQATINSAPTCTSKQAGQQNYYFPEPIGSTSGSDTTEITDFKSKCTSDQLITELSSIIEIDSPSSSLPNGVSRSINTTQALQHRLTVVYSSGNQSKSYTLTPTVAAWCP